MEKPAIAKTVVELVPFQQVQRGIQAAHLTLWLTSRQPVEKVPHLVVNHTLNRDIDHCGLRQPRASGQPLVPLCEPCRFCPIVIIVIDDQTTRSVRDKLDDEDLTMWIGVH